MAIPPAELAVEGGEHRLTGWDLMWVGESGRGWRIHLGNWRGVVLSGGIIYISVGAECYCSLLAERLR